MRREDLVVKYSVYIEYKGRIVIDPFIAQILEKIREKRSLYKTAQNLGIPYSKIWDIIDRVERLTGEKLVERYKGGRGGGASLTSFGEELLKIYNDAKSLLERKLGSLYMSGGAVTRPELIIAHSDDLLINILINNVRNKDVKIQSLCLGSGLSLAMLSIGEVDVACIHLYDPVADSYNDSYLDRFWLKDRVEKIISYWREQVLAFKDQSLIKTDLDEIFRKIFDGELRIGIRNRGSGTRILFEYLLRRYSKILNKDLDKVKGLESEYNTHLETAVAINERKIDLALMPRYAAEKNRLYYKSVAWERYECFMRKEIFNSDVAAKFISEIRDEKIREIIKDLPGYKIE
ncbi:MAG: LysR family transcriptional regulator [Desulfurococcales archaeon]|jgi:molybdate transport repressor ModE-like protein|nr:LysR family transcriptional regulator [Desulfurococcales archaeon]MCC6062567.1 LysR family transcriptional regulator [Desulfurococcales archaeon]